MENTNNRAVVQLPGITGQVAPNFLIEHKGKFYLTLAVLEYDPEHPDKTQEHHDGIGLIRDLHEKHCKECSSTACEVSLFSALRGLNTSPDP